MAAELIAEHQEVAIPPFTVVAGAGELAVQYGFVGFNGNGEIDPTPPSDEVGTAYLHMIEAGYI